METQMQATIVQLKGSDDQIINVLMQMGWANSGTLSPLNNSATPGVASEWSANRAETFKKDLVAHNLQNVVEIVKNNPGMLGADLVKTLKLQNMKALAGKLAAVTKLARRHGPKDSLAITSAWVGKDYAYSIIPELLPHLK